MLWHYINIEHIVPFQFLTVEFWCFKNPVNYDAFLLLKLFMCINTAKNGKREDVFIHEVSLKYNQNMGKVISILLLEMILPD